MATNLLLRRGTAAEAAAYTGGEGELFVDLDNNQVYVHDGVTAGGVPLVGGASIVLSDLSVGPEGTASGDGSIAYDNTTGVFTYTPPVIPSDLTDLSISDGTNGQILTTDGAGNFSFTTVGGVSNTLDGLTDVTITSVADGEVLAYDSGTSSWVNTTSSGVDLSAISQSIIPDTDVAYDLGSATNKFRDLYLSGSTIKLGDATISASGTDVIISGINELRFKPNNIVDARVEVGGGSAYYNSDTTAINSIIIDELTYLIATDTNYAALKNIGWTPTTYNATFDGSGNITDVSINTAQWLPEESGFDQLEIVNTQLIALDPGTDINDWDSIAASLNAIPLYAFLEHISEAYSPISSGLAPVATTGAYSDLTGTPTLSTVATSGAYGDLTGTPTIPTDVSELADATSLLFSGSYTDLTDKPTIYTDSDTASYLSTNGYDTATNIIASITDSAPATLDTLNELAAALGDDPNFATTVTNSIATKASLSGATFTGNVAFQGVATFTNAISEYYTLMSSTSGTIEHDLSTGSTFYYSNGLSANITANFTNVPAVDSANGNIVSVALIIDQASTAYIPSVVQIAGTARTIRWADASVPSGNANQTDVVSFTFIRRDGSWIVLGVLNTFG